MPATVEFQLKRFRRDLTDWVRGQLFTQVFAGVEFLQLQRVGNEHPALGAIAIDDFIDDFLVVGESGRDLTTSHVARGVDIEECLVFVNLCAKIGSNKIG